MFFGDSNYPFYSSKYKPQQPSPPIPPPVLNQPYPPMEEVEPPMLVQPPMRTMPPMEEEQPVMQQPMEPCNPMEMKPIMQPPMEQREPCRCMQPMMPMQPSMTPQMGMPENKGTVDPTAIAYVRGGPIAPQVSGTVLFTDVPGGVMVSVNINGLPSYRPAQDGHSPIGPFGFHIHSIGNCTPGTFDRPFPDTNGHWNPTNQPHGNHAGDFPVLFSNSGTARMDFFTNKFRVNDIIGKSVIIHHNPDDYRTQPAGNSGKPMACGVIRAYR